jgi:hypothetical protein
MDPTVEQLHTDYQERLREASTRRELTAEVTASALLLVACGLLIALAPHPGRLLTVQSSVLVVLYVLVRRVTFEVGTGDTTPVQLVFVPMWFVVAPSYLPVLVILGEVLDALINLGASRGARHPSRLLIAVPDAWFAIGPAVVLAAFGHGAPVLSDWPIYLLALLAQFIVDGGTGTLRVWAATGVRPALQLRLLLWVDMVDVALFPFGLFAAILMTQSAWVIVSVLPMVFLLAQFSRERDRSIEQAHDLSTAYRGTAQLMGDVLEADDEYTGGEHTQGVVELSLLIGGELGLSASDQRDLEFGALLHDIGKLRVPKEIINKPGKLTAEEWAIIKLHPEWGQEMLDKIGGVLAQAGTIVRAHHERVDGGGYPDGLTGTDIPLAARIITVCDSFSAMTTDRSYRKALSHDEAICELERCAGSQFDADVVRALRAVVDRGDAVANAETIALAVRIVDEDERLSHPDAGRDVA